MTPIFLAHPGERLKIVKIDAGQSLQTRLKHLGLMEGDVVRILQSVRGGVIVAKGTLRLALGYSRKVLAA